MGRVEGDEHGVCGATSVCRDGHAAIVRRQRLPWSWVERPLLHTLLLCETCARDLSSAVVDEELEDFMERVTIVRGACAASWPAAFEQGPSRS